MNLEDAFLAYTDLVRERLASVGQRSAETRPVKRPAYNVLDLTRLFALRSLIEDIESKSEFQTLVSVTALRFATEHRKDTPFIHDLWKWNVEAFFRRSGFYLLEFNGEKQDIQATLKLYTQAFEKKTSTIKHLIPLEFVEFDEYSMDFGGFSIAQLSRDDLESLLQNEINHVFYPHAHADISNLADLWFLVVYETTDALEPGSGGLMELLGPEVGTKFTRFAPVVESSLKHLALYDWGTYQASWSASEKSGIITDLDTGWVRFHVPFVITIDQNLLWTPKALPDLSVLATEPVFSDEGDEIGERCVRTIFVETEQFKSVIQRIATKMTELNGMQATQWPFLDVALGYLAKAFFADGLDQLLWHIVVFESLLGDKGDSERGLTARLKDRGAFVIANSEQELPKIKKKSNCSALR